MGINEQNILDRQSPRNRRIADIFAKCGLLERSGQGMNLMYELCIQESKSTPDFSGSDQYQIVLNLDGEVQDPRFLQFLEKVGRETLKLFSTADFLLLDHIHRERKIPEHLKRRLQSLVDMGVVERFGRGRGVKYVLSRLYEILQVLPALTVDQVKTLLREMKAEGQIYVAGRTSAARWFPE